MAEALGVSAAVVQFVDIGLRLCLRLHSFCSEVRDVPQKLNALQDHLKQQIEVASSIQNSVLGASVLVDDSSEALLKSILEDQRRVMEHLFNLLESVTNKSGDNILRRSWNGIRAIDKKKDIESACDQLEAKMRLLSSWLGNTAM